LIYIYNESIFTEWRDKGMEKYKDCYITDDLFEFEYNKVKILFYDRIVDSFKSNKSKDSKYKIIWKYQDQDLDLLHKELALETYNESPITSAHAYRGRSEIDDYTLVKYPILK